MRRGTPVAGAVLGLLAAFMIGPGWLMAAPAQAAPVTVAIDGAASVFDTTATTTYTVVVSGGAVSDLGVVTHQDPALPADDDSVTDAKIDAVPAPPGSVRRTGPDLSFDLGPRTVGSYTVTFPVSLVSTDPATYRSTAAATYAIAGVAAVPVTSTDVIVSVGQTTAPPVDLAVAAEDPSSIDDPILLGRNQGGDLLAYVDNAGTATTTADVLIDSAPGLVIGEVIADDAVTVLPCTAVAGNPQQRRCAVPAISPGDDHGQVLDIRLTASPTALVGATASVGVSITPTPDATVEADPSDNSATAFFQFVGQADLSYSLTPASSRVLVGRTVTIRAGVTNHGPDDAPTTVALAMLQHQLTHFAIVGFTGATIPVSSSPVPLRARATADDPNALLWSIGTLAPGQSASATLTLRATSPGTEGLTLLAISSATDPDCVNQLDCPPAQITLTAFVPAPPVQPTPPAPRPPPSTSSAPMLPETGTPTGRLALAGLALLLSGGLLIRAAQSRPTPR